MNGINCDVPHKFLREVMTGKKEEWLRPVNEQPEDRIPHQNEQSENGSEQQSAEENDVAAAEDSEGGSSIMESQDISGDRQTSD